MTRETKIGLLVGLAFIIVVGILLSEHLTSTVERPVAQLSDAGKSVRRGVSAPGVDTSDESAPIKVAEPSVPVPTASELQRPLTNGSTQVAIGGGNAQGPIVISSNDNQKSIENLIKPANPQQAETQQSGQSEGPIVIKTPNDPFANDPLRQAAKQHGEEIVPVGGQNGKSTSTDNGTTLAANNAREYQAQPGDTLSRIASLLPGGATKNNRDAIVKLNPSLQKDPNKIIAGKKYLLPTDSAPVDNKTVVQQPLVQQPALVEKKAEPVASKDAKDSKDKSNSFRTYVVQKGDTLTKIAQEQCGSKSAVATIVDLNQDVLKDHNVIQVNMKLKLPAKETTTTSTKVASSN